MEKRQRLSPENPHKHFYYWLLGFPKIKGSWQKNNKKMGS